MKFGQCEVPELVDFTLRPYNEDDTAILNAKAHKGPLKLYTGSTSWINKEWKGSIYPQRFKAADSLDYYGKQFNAIELNTTHYRIPTDELVKKWISKVPSDFKFCPKAPQSISHRKDLGLTSGAFHEFMNILPFFAGHLGCTFIQCPTYFNATHLPLIEQLITNLPEPLSFAIELRDESFYSKSLSQTIKEHLIYKKVSWVVTDTAGRRDIVHNHITSDFLFVRFVACGVIEIDQKRLDEWINRILLLQEKGMDSIYFFFHDPDHYTRAEMAIYLHRQLIDQKDIQFRGPNLNQYNGQQTKLF